MSHLQKQRAVAKSLAAFDTLATGDTFILIDSVFKVRIFNIGSNDGIRRASQVFTSRIKFTPMVLIITAAKQAITTGGELVNTLDCRLRQDAFGGTFAALRAFFRINLPKRQVAR
jgi:hypothetical protein